MRISPPNAWRWPWAAILALLVLGSYATVLATAGWIWDDDEYVTRNPVLSDAFDGGLWKIWFDPSATPQYYPLVHTSFWLECRLFPTVTVTELGRQFVEPHPTGFHATNVVLMILTVWTFWRILLRLAVPGAFLAAAVFAVHPLNVESVAWVTERKNMLSGLFALAAIHSYLRFAGVGAPSPRRASHWLVAFVFWAGAVLSKSVVAFVPPAIFLLVWWRQPDAWRRHILPLLPFLITGVIAGLHTAHLEANQVSGGIRFFDLTLLDRVLLSGRIVWTYVWHTLWPVEQIFSYPKWDPDPADMTQWILLAGVGAFLGAMVWSVRKLGRGPLVAVLIFGGGLVPVMGFFDVYPFRFSWVADHFQYHANFALFALLGAALSRVRLPTGVAMAAGGVLILALAGLTARQGLAYKDRETIWRDTLAKNPQSWLAHSELGEILRLRGEAEAAIAQFKKGLAIYKDARLLAGLGGAELDLYDRTKQRRHLDQAIDWTEQALVVKPNLSMARAMIGELYTLAGPEFRHKVVEHLERMHEFVLQEPRHRLDLRAKYQSPIVRGAMEKLHRTYGILAQEKLAGGDARGAYELLSKASLPFAQGDSPPWRDLYDWRVGSPWFDLELQRLWLLTASADDSIRKPKLAGDQIAALTRGFLTRMRDAGVPRGTIGQRQSQLMDLRAAALAANGDFKAAQEAAQETSSMAFRMRAPAKWIRAIEARRDQYAERRPFRIERSIPSPRGR